jgi:hypothetical protein
LIRAPLAARSRGERYDPSREARMFDWLKRKRRDGKPLWSQVLNARQEERFDELVNARLAESGESARAEGGIVRLRGQTCGLGNLAQLCAKLPADDWPRVIDEHFAGIRQAEVDEVEWERRKHEFDWIAPQLCLRLHTETYEVGDGTTQALADLAVTRTDLPGVATVLVADRPTVITTIPREMPAAWGRSWDELFALALSNLAARYPVDIGPVDVDPARGITVHVLEAQHLFAASHALRLEAWPELVGPHGTLLAVPNRHSLLAWPIGSGDVLAAAAAMAGLAHHGCANVPGSIVPHLYWRGNDRTFAVLEVEVEGRQMSLKPSPEFQARIERVLG